MPGTFAYDEATNTIEVTDVTAGAPATFNDMFVADQAGIGTILLDAGDPNEGGAGANNPLALDYAVRPTHDKALLVKCIVANKAEAPVTDFIFITGLDWRGAAQTESIDVTAGNGSYTTTKYWSSITTLDCSDNAAGGGTVWADGDLSVTQDIWGVVWEHVADGQYKIDCNINFGNGSNATYFTSLNELVYFADTLTFVVRTNATLQLGELSGDWGINGSTWSVAPSSNHSFIVHGDILLYCSVLEVRTNIQFRFAGSGTADIRNSILKYALATGSSRIFSFLINFTPSFNRVYISQVEELKIYEGSTSFNVHVHDATYGVDLSTPQTATGILFTDTVKDIRTGTGNLGINIIKDPVEPIDGLLIQSNTVVIEQYTANIHVTDKDGVALQNATVDCEYAHLVEGSDSKTYKCIQDHTSVDATHKPITGSDWEDYWELYDADGGLGGVWQTTFDFKAGTQEFAQDTTDANGDISEQVIQYKRWVGTSALLDVRIHKFTFTHASYPDFVMNDIYIDHPLVWEFDMGQSSSDLLAINEAAIDNKINLTAGVVDQVGALTDKAGFSLSTAGILAIWHQLTAAVVTASTMGKLVIDFLNAAVSTRATSAKQDTMETTLGVIADDVTNIDQIRAWALGDWQPKSGVPGTYQVLDPDDGVTPVMEVTPDGTTGILQVEIL